MRISRSLLLGGALLAAPLLTASPAQAQTNTHADALMTRFAEAWSADDSTAVSQLFTDDVVIVGSDGAFTNREAVEAWRRQQMAGTDAMEITPLRSGMSGDLAYQTGRWALGYGGGAGTATGSHTFVFRKGDDGTWRTAAISIGTDLQE